MIQSGNSTTADNVPVGDRGYYSGGWRCTVGMEVYKEVKLSMGTKVFSRNGVKCHRHNTYRGMRRHVANTS